MVVCGQHSSGSGCRGPSQTPKNTGGTIRAGGTCYSVWSAKGSYHKYTTMVLQTIDGYNSAWIRDARIELWQPRLNHPYAHRYLTKQAAAIEFSNSENHEDAYKPTSKDCSVDFAEVCNPLLFVHNRQCPQSKLLRILSSFEATRDIRSQKFTDVEVYAPWSPWTLENCTKHGTTDEI